MRLPGKIPFSIHPFFWLIAALIGWFNSGNLIGTVIWVGIIFVSVVIHEYGHATAALFFGKHPRVDLVAFGGVTSYEMGNLSFWKQFVIVFNGPLFGFILFAVFYLLLHLHLSANPLWVGIVATMEVVNLFWTILNLIPVLPLDGGQLLRIILESFWGLKGIKASFIVGMCIAVAVSFFFFILQAFLIGALFFLFAFHSFDTYRKTQFLSESDRDEETRKRMQRAEASLSQGNKGEAKALLQNVLAHASSGILHNTASQYLAFLLFEEGKRHEAYELLLSVKEGLPDEAVCLMHELAFEEKNFELVTHLATSCYRMVPSQEVALRNAKAFASLQFAKQSGGWLQTAWNMGTLDVENILKESIFDPVRKNPEFIQFISKLQ